MPPEAQDRRSEWFVPQFGPLKFRLFVGLLFLPYTGMVLSFTVIGGVIAPQIDWERVIVLLAIYFLALGIGAHALDALGSKTLKPWGSVFPRRALIALACASVIAAYAIGIYYIVRYSPMLWPIAILEGFFLLAYNLEWFGGRFHNDFWFAVSWGFLPVLAGYVLQTNSLSTAAVLVAGAMGCLSLVEIKASRPYKELKRSSDGAAAVRPYEAILKSVSGGVILLAAGLAASRLLT